jgi:hypothetical protein
VAEELIAIGVRCVIAAGWAVDDTAAGVFARTFYEALLPTDQKNGCRFIDAVAQAREAAWAVGGNTWAAYQCYGDPDWTFKPADADAQRPVPPADEFSGVTSPTALLIALETVAVQSEFQKADAQKQRDKIRYLADHFAHRWGDIGRVAEAFGKACILADDTAGGLAWYERALRANDGTASMRVAEQLGNIRARVGPVEPKRRRGAASKGSRKAARGSSARAGVETARKSIEQSILYLEQIVALAPSMERESLCGSAYKRLALLEAGANRARQELDAIKNMRAHYARAEDLGKRERLNVFYPAMNRIVADLALNAGTRALKEYAASAFGEVRQILDTKTRDDPDFWSVAGQTELDVYEALALRDLARKLAGIDAAYQDLHGRLTTPWMWKSVYDTARFVLSKYATRAPAAEKTAARALLKILGGFAGSDVP